MAFPFDIRKWDRELEGEPSPLAMPDISSLVRDDDLYRQGLAIIGKQNASAPEFIPPEIEKAPEKLEDDEAKRLQWKTIGEFMTALGQLTGGPGGSIGPVTQDVGVARQASDARLRENKTGNREIDNQIAVAESTWKNRMRQEAHDRETEFKRENVKDLIERERNKEEYKEKLKADAAAKVAAWEMSPERTSRMVALYDHVIDITTKTGAPMSDAALRRALTQGKFEATAEQMDHLRDASQQGVVASKRADRLREERYGPGSKSSLTAEARALQAQRPLRQASVDDAGRKLDKAGRNYRALSERMGKLEDTFVDDTGIDLRSIDPNNVDEALKGIKGEDDKKRDRHELAVGRYAQYLSLLKRMEEEEESLAPLFQNLETAERNLSDLDRELSRFGGLEATPVPEDDRRDAALKELADFLEGT